MLPESEPPVPPAFAIDFRKNKNPIHKDGIFLCFFSYDFVKGDERMCPKETAAAVTSLAVMITEKLTPEQSALVASVFVQLGDTIATIISAENLCQNKK